MKKPLHYLLAGWLLLGSLTACKHQIDSLEPNPPDTNNPGNGDPGQPGNESPDGGTVKPVGTPQGTAIVKTIGASGGTIQTADDRFKVSIPAGALNKDVAVSLQPITNTNSSGKGTAYRLTPDGQQFVQPVTLTIKYQKDDLKGTMSGAFGIAYQNDKGVWIAVAGAQIDTTNRTVSIKTTHFTDWSFFEAFRIIPELNVIDPGQTSFVMVTCSLVLPELAPLVKDAPLQDHETFTEYIDQWELQGEGELKVDAAKGQATYQSPNRIPAKNPIQVIVHIHSPGKAIGFLIAKIYVVPEGVSVSVGGGDWKRLNAPSGYTNDGTISAYAGKDYIHLVWPGQEPGIFGWTNESVGVTLFMDGAYYTMLHIDESVSGGALTIDEMGPVAGSDVIGTFIATDCQSVITGNPPVIGLAGVKGVFRVKRKN
jgi:hypothetical protein